MSKFYIIYSSKIKVVIMSISFQGHVPQSEKRQNTKWAVIGAPLLAGGQIVTETLVNKDLRKDSFIKTAKEGAKVFINDCKNVAAGFCKYVLRNEKLADKVFKLASNDKRVLAIGLAVNTILSFGLLKFTMDCASKFNHRKD